MKRTAWAFALGCCLLLAAQPASAQPPTGAFVEVTGGRLWTETCGAGPKAMVLLHDGLLHSAGWDDVWPQLCERFHVVRYDRRGFGRSPAATAAYAPVEDVAAVMRASRMPHAVLVGASAGGGIAVDFALAHPAKTERLVLVGPDVSGFPYSEHFQTRIGQLQAQVAKGDLRGALKTSWMMARGDEANVERLAALFAANPQDLRHADLAQPAPPAAPRLGQIEAPTMVLVGEDDVADNQARAGALEYAIPGTRRVVIGGAGHMLYMEQPAQFVRLVEGFADPAPAAASPGTEAALRAAIDEMRRGEFDDGRYSLALAAAMRRQADQAKRLLGAAGPLTALTFKGVGDQGGDIYGAVFEKGRAEWRIKLDKSGRIERLIFKPGV